MKKIKITITTSIPDEATCAEAVEWAEFVTGYSGSITPENPIYVERDADVAAESCYVRFLYRERNQKP